MDRGSTDLPIIFPSLRHKICYKAPHTANRRRPASTFFFLLLEHGFELDLCRPFFLSRLVVVVAAVAGSNKFPANERSICCSRRRCYGLKNPPVTDKNCLFWWKLQGNRAIMAFASFSSPGIPSGAAEAAQLFLFFLNWSTKLLSTSNSNPKFCSKSHDLNCPNHWNMGADCGYVLIEG